MAPVASGMAFGSPLAIRSRKRLWHSAKPGMGSAPHARDFAGRLTGWVWVPNSASKNATSSFEPTWIMMISFSLGWSDAAGGAFETIWFQQCFRRVSSPRAMAGQQIGNCFRDQKVIGASVRMHDRHPPNGLSSPPGWGRFPARANSTRARVLVSHRRLPGQLVAAGTPKDGNRPLG